MRKISATIFLFLVFACNNKNSTYVDKYSVIIHEHDYYSKNYKTFIPTKEDISKGLILFKKEINSSDYFFKGSPEIVDSVYKQYFGYYDDDHKVLMINCLCELMEFPDSIDYFNRKLIIPDDGGICYFRGYVNLSNNKVELQVNGN
ncbi:hypothetical protein [Marivirga harenae]|uniref:hypothetical protein n=1 Tax=Marivirga harenae TaxID=2010992 RepID=UPI0026E06E69|nr:hypothetical protein [Marivirga harenae]WKV11820.1 hypothetical protein Q3Y49_16580 [Marivirga harenae]|tara:strand:+ start:348292 stop:348729 length:438 start_codon:yes stop_codon:yes gene_type:complete